MNYILDVSALYVACTGWQLKISQCAVQGRGLHTRPSGDGHPTFPRIRWSPDLPTSKPRRGAPNILYKAEQFRQRTLRFSLAKIQHSCPSTLLICNTGIHLVQVHCASNHFPRQQCFCPIVMASKHVIAVFALAMVLLLCGPDLVRCLARCPVDLPTCPADMHRSANLSICRFLHTGCVSQPVWRLRKVQRPCRSGRLQMR